jgi:Uncharacterized protein conserved in bacteria
LLILAGPNGSGKSTTVNKILNSPYYPGEYISPDEAVKLSLFDEIVDHKKRYISAMQFCEDIRNDLLMRGRPFCFETVLSTPEKISFLSRAKKLGYLIESIYITTKDPDINVSRVARRHSQGGHDVPVDKIHARYARSMALVPDLMKISDNMVIIDSSEDYKEQIIVVKNNYNWVGLHSDTWEPWIKDKIITPLMDSGLELEYRELDSWASKAYLSIEKKKNHTLMGLFVD